MNATIAVDMSHFINRIVIIGYSCDVDGIKYVINYDYPHSSEDYIHRIGRTGRSDTIGTSYTFFTPTNYKQARDLVSVLQEANQIIDPKLAELAARCGFNGRQSRWGQDGGFKSKQFGFNKGGFRNSNGYNSYKSSNGYSNGNSY